MLSLSKHSWGFSAESQETISVIFCLRDHCTGIPALTQDDVIG